MLKKILFCLAACLLLSGVMFAQEALKSVEEEYYDFLALQGLTKRPYLNYRTLSDSVWSVDEKTSHPWQGQNLGTLHPLFGNFRMKIYGPELFMSLNTAAPYGQNDGALWQGRGFNSSLTGGIRFEGYGVELTFKPQLAFSQNAAFDIMPSAYENEYGYFWSYGNKNGVDAPQRFGDKPFFTYDWGDSEIRYSWKTLTIGFGTQAVWLGPAYLNPILHSNNAPTYPRFDIGLRRQRVTIPWINWYAGDVELRLWVGRLSESDYFDSDNTNDDTMIHALVFAYAPSFLPGLTLFANRICLVPWAWENIKFIFPLTENTIEDQKASFGFSWIFSEVGLEVYGELGVDDYVYGGILGYMRDPTWTMVYEMGLKKTIEINSAKNIYSELILELDWMERTQPTETPPRSSYSFYFHHQIIHGYTNKGQWLGNASSPGGNSQYFKFILYYPQGNSQIIIGRNNPDRNYLFNTPIDGFNNSWGNFLLGINTIYFVKQHIIFSGGLLYNLIINQNYVRQNEEIIGGRIQNGNDTHTHNFNFVCSIKLIF